MKQNNKHIEQEADRRYPTENTGVFAPLQRSAFRKGATWMQDNQWVSVADRLPETDKEELPLIVWLNDCFAKAIFIPNIKSFYNHVTLLDITNQVTHYQIIKPPKM